VRHEASSLPQAAAGEREGPESGPADGIAGEIQLASAPDGRTVLSWIDFDPKPEGAKGPLRAQFFTAAGKPAGPPATLDTPNALPGAAQGHSAGASRAHPIACCACSI
jgi:hypothetical protein